MSLNGRSQDHSMIILAGLVAGMYGKDAPGWD
jgi:hypothetical protein